LPEKEYAVVRQQIASKVQKAMLFAGLSDCNLISFFVWLTALLMNSFFCCYSFKSALNLEDKQAQHA